MKKKLTFILLLTVFVILGSCLGYLAGILTSSYYSPGTHEPINSIDENPSIKSSKYEAIALEALRCGNEMMEHFVHDAQHLIENEGITHKEELTKKLCALLHNTIKKECEVS